MYNKLLFLFVFLSAVINAQQSNNTQQALNQTNKSFFIQNKGQWDPEVKYLACIGGMNAWITTTGVVYDYYRIQKNIDETKSLKMNPREKQDIEKKNATIQGHVVKMQLVDAEKEVISIGNNQREGYYNYFMSNDKSKWASFVPLYDNVEIQGIYKNIDVKYYYDYGMLRYDYKAKPGADLSQIKLKFDGQEGMSVNAKGELILKTSIGEVTNGKLYAYQMEGKTQKEVPCQFEQRDDGSIGLNTTGYNEKKELIIDPMVYSTFIGASGGLDQGFSITIDAGGNAYITGMTYSSTYSSSYPTTTGAYKTKGYGVFVTKLNSSGSDLVYSTFIGGANFDQGNSIAIDANGNAYITGQTDSPDYPTTSGAFQTTFGGFTLHAYEGDAFVTKLNSSGSELVYSTYIGGHEGDEGKSIAIDAAGNAFITGFTKSSDYPTTTGAYQNTYGGTLNVGFGGDAFITKLNSTGTGLIYSTYMGGNGDDYGSSIAIDAEDNAYITGRTSSQNYPTTAGAYQTTYGGDISYDSNGDSFGDSFITKLNSKGSGLVYSTYIGGNYRDVSNSIAVDADGNAYITGETWSSNYPTTPGAYQTKLTATGTFIEADVFVTKLNPTGTTLVYSTFIGGSSFDYGNSIAVDARGNAYITGETYSSDYPSTSGAFQTTFGCEASDAGGNGFITELNSSGSGLFYSTFLGGHSTDCGNSIVVDANGNAYITGSATSSNYPTSLGSYQTNGSGVFITKLNIPQTPLTHDVGILKINGAAQFTGGTSYVPSVQIRNYGTVTESFNVLCKIFDYKGNVLTQNTQTITNLIPDSIRTVNFLPYTLMDNYLYKIEFTTQLSGDNNADNNIQSIYINSYSNTKKSVLVEVFGGTWCAYSPGAQLGCNDLLSNGKNITVIDYNSGETFYTTEGNLRHSYYYGLTEFPTAFFDGVLRCSVGNYSNSMYGTYLPLYDSMYSVKTPLDMNIVGKITTQNNYNITINVHKLAPFINPNTKLFVALTENKIPYSWEGQTEVDYCERMMLPDRYGFTIDMLTHDSVSIPFTLTTQSSWSVANLELSAWVQDIDTREIFNTTKVKIADFSKWQENINVKDNGNVLQSLTFGQSLIATNGIDTALGEAPLPPPPFGFDARFHLPTGDDSWMDYRSSSKDTVKWIVKFQPGSGGYPITFTWDKTALPKGKITLTDAVTGTIVNVDMTTSSSYTLTNTGINSLIIQYIAASTSTSVKNINTEIPTEFSLMQNYPNPFNPTTVIKYGLPGISNVKLKIYNVLGQLVESLVNGTQNAGFHELTWNASNNASGIYLCSIEAISADGKDNFHSVKKLLLLK